MSETKSQKTIPEHELTAETQRALEIQRGIQLASTADEDFLRSMQPIVSHTHVRDTLVTVTKAKPALKRVESTTRSIFTPTISHEEELLCIMAQPDFTFISGVRTLSFTLTTAEATVLSKFNDWILKISDISSNNRHSKDIKNTYTQMINRLRQLKMLDPHVEGDNLKRNQLDEYFFPDLDEVLQLPVPILHANLVYEKESSSLKPPERLYGGGKGSMHNYVHFFYETQEQAYLKSIMIQEQIADAFKNSDGPVNIFRNSHTRELVGNLLLAFAGIYKLHGKISSARIQHTNSEAVAFLYFVHSIKSGKIDDLDSFTVYQALNYLKRHRITNPLNELKVSLEPFIPHLFISHLRGYFYGLFLDNGDLTDSFL